MADSKLFNWCKLILENKWLILLLISFVTSAAGNVIQEKQVKEKDEHLTMLADSYRTVVYSQIQPEAKLEVKPDIKPIPCQCDMKAHIREFH